MALTTHLPFCHHEQGFQLKKRVKLLIFETMEEMVLLSGAGLFLQACALHALLVTSTS